MHDADIPLSKDDFETIRRLEESLWIAQSRFDNALMDKLFARDFFEFGRSGRTYGRGEMLLEASPGQTIASTIPLPRFHARHLSPDIIQVTYISEVVYGGEIERANRSSIWSREGDGWVLRFHQGTPVADQSDGSAREMSHLLSSSTNVDRLRSGLDQLRRGEVIESDPTED
jgi:hypothetical protein